MKAISCYCSLPDSMSEKDVACEFHDLLQVVLGSGRLKYEFLEAALELSDRQWHTYKPLDQLLKVKVEQALISRWDGFDFAFAEGSIIVAAKLGLVGFFEFISSRSAGELSPDVAMEIKEALAELGADISDPYSGM